MATGLLSVAVSLVALVVGSFLIVQHNARRRRGAPFPPGPKPNFILGNVRDIPKEYQWKAFADWRKPYGDIVHLEAFGRHIIIINSYKTARELLDKQAALHSSRPTQPMLGVLMGYNTGIGFSAYGTPWRERRKLVHQTTSKAAMPNFYPDLTEGVHKLLNGFLESPEQFTAHLRLAIGAIIMKATYGIHVTSATDPYLTKAELVIKGIGVAPFGTYLVDIIPALSYIPSWFPFAKFKREAKKWRTLREEFSDIPLEYVKQQMASGINESSIASRSIGNHPERYIKDSCGALYAAGTDTTLIALKSVLLAMTLFPEVLARAHEAVDAVLGPVGDARRLPTFEDRPRLPYIDALIKEALRWHVAAPVGINHSSIQDSIFQGYFIPKDSVIYPNQWLMSRDEEYYDSPSEFRPERFLGDKPELDSYQYIFGFGRRICVGMHFADAALYIATASILAAFDILPPLGENGKENPSELDPLHAGYAPEFDCRLIPRSESMAVVIQQAVESSA